MYIEYLDINNIITVNSIMMNKCKYINFNKDYELLSKFFEINKIYTYEYLPENDVTAFNKKIIIYQNINTKFHTTLEEFNEYFIDISQLRNDKLNQLLR